MSNRTVVVAILAGVLLLALAAGWQITPTVRRARESARDRAQAQQRDGVPATRGFWDKRRHERNGRTRTFLNGRSASSGWPRPRTGSSLRRRRTRPLPGSATSPFSGQQDMKRVRPVSALHTGGLCGRLPLHRRLPR